MSASAKEGARKILSNTAPEKAFWVNNGPVLKSLIELAEAARKLTPQQFAHHVSNAKNDFANWVDQVIRDSALARKIRQIKTREELADTITNRLRRLKKALK